LALRLGPRAAATRGYACQRMRACIALPCALLLASCATTGHGPRLAAPPHQTGSQTWPSGIRLVAYALPHRPDALVSASYRVGSAHDPPGKEGLAHLAEHLAFRGRPGGGATLWDRLEAAGVEFDGQTSADATDFHEVGDPEQLDALLAVEADRLRDPLAGVGEAELRREREVMVQELALRADPASAAAQVQWLTARALPGHAYGRAETAGSIRAITLEDVRAFVRAHYTPANVVLLVVGPTPPDEVRRAAAAALGALAAGPPAPAMPPVPPPDLAAPVPRALEIRRAPVERPALWIAWTVPGDAAQGNAPVFAALRQLEARLDGALAGKEKARAVSTELYTHGMDGASLAVARVRLRRAKDAGPVLDALRAELKFRGWQGAEELAAERLRDRLVLDAHVRLEGLDATEIARWIRATGRADYLAELPDAVGRALSGGGQGYVSRWLREDRLVAMAVVPGDAPASDPAEQLAGASALSEGEHHGPGTDAGPVPDPARGMRPPHLDAALRRRLPNGLEVVISPRPGYRVVSAHLVVRTEPAGPLQRVFEVLALRGATCSERPATVAGDRLEFGARAPTELVNEALAQVGCRAGELSIDGPAFDKARDELAEALERSTPTLHERAGQALLERLYPGHPYAVEVTAERVRAFSASEAGRWLGASVRPDRAALLVVGDVVPGDALWSAIEHRFGSWRSRRGGGALPARATAPEPTARSVVVIDRSGWPSAEVVVGVRVPPRHARDEPAFRTLAGQLEHALTARLRLAGGLTYRVSTSVLEQSLGATLLVSTVVDRGRAGEVLGAVLDALAAATRPLDPEALSRARWRAVRQAGRGLGTSWRNALRLQEMFVHALPDDEWDTFARRTAALGPEALRAAARTWATGREAILLVGDAAALVPALRALGLAPQVITVPR
jgi:zinc protease